MKISLARVLAGALVSVFAFSACNCMPDIVSAPFEAKDLRPASLKSWGASSRRELVLAFDETVRAQAKDFAFSRQEGSAMPESLAVESLSAAENGENPAESRIVLLVSADFDPGIPYAVSGIVYDDNGNATNFTLPFWGFNPDTPELLINEVLTEGSEKHPDAIELFVRRGGNLAGAACFIGTSSDFDARYVFPPCTVATGEYIVLHLKPEGIAAELDELDSTDVSGGFDASAGGRDFWYRNPAGASLPGKNGVVSVYGNPNGSCLDALVYSERSAESDQKYGGFGTARLRDRVETIVAAGAWNTAGLPARPEDAARSAGVTSTRTLCRSSGSGDSGGGSDWHVVPTKGSSLGAVNSDQIYQP